MTSPAMIRECLSKANGHVNESHWAKTFGLSPEEIADLIRQNSEIDPRNLPEAGGD